MDDMIKNEKKLAWNPIRYGCLVQFCVIRVGAYDTKNPVLCRLDDPNIGARLENDLNPADFGDKN